MAWQFSISFTAEEEDQIREEYPHDSTKELQKQIKDVMKAAVLDEEVDSE